MYTFVSILVILVSIFLILIVLVQNSKGGGLASNFAGNNQYLGVRKTADFLEKSTWTLAVVLLVLSLFSIFVIPRSASNNDIIDTELREQIENTDPLPAEMVPPPAEDAQ